MKNIILLAIAVFFSLTFIACESTKEINSNDVVVPNSNSDSNVANTNVAKDVANANANSNSSQPASDKKTEKDKTPEPAQKPKKDASPKPTKETKTEVKPPPPTGKMTPRPTRRKPAPKKTPWRGKSDADKSGNQNN